LLLVNHDIFEVSLASTRTTDVNVLPSADTVRVVTMITLPSFRHVVSSVRSSMRSMSQRLAIRLAFKTVMGLSIVGLRVDDFFLAAVGKGD
jgi:hypothetical protein